MGVSPRPPFPRQAPTHWGEDGLLGWCDRRGLLNFGIALWNGNDPILKERLFGLTNSEGNHGEDVKELYYFVDGLPTAAYMKGLYKYPIAAYPYEQLVNHGRSKADRELELLDTGVMDDGYFDVLVEYAKPDASSVAIQDLRSRTRMQPSNQQTFPETSSPTVVSEQVDVGAMPEVPLPTISLAAAGRLVCFDGDLGHLTFYHEGPASPLFTENETNNERIFGTPKRLTYVKDAFHRYVDERGDKGSVDQTEKEAPRAGADLSTHAFAEAGASRSIHHAAHPGPQMSEARHPRRFRTQLFATRIAEADAFYAATSPGPARRRLPLVQRQAFAGLALGGKQALPHRC